jgi:glycosyltransferase involved in cell wall biosynthesis
MKLLILSSKFPPDHSPEAIHTEFIARVLAGRGVAVTVVTSVWNTARSDLFVVRPVMPGWGFRHLKRLLGEIRRERPDAVLLIYLGWIYDFNPMVTALPWFCRRMQHRPRFVTLFENLQPKQDAWTRRMGWIRKVPGLGRTHPRFGRLLVDGDAVVALARAHLHQLVEAEPAVAGKGIVIPAPPLLSPVNDLAGKIRRRGRSELGVADEALLLAFFGFVYRGKGVEILLHALSILLERNLAVRLVIIGEFSEPDYHTELKSIVTALSPQLRAMGCPW